MKKGLKIPGYERGGYASYENGNRGISKLGSIIDMASNNTNTNYPNPIPHEHPVYRVQNGMMANGGYLGYMESNPQGGGVMYTNGVRTHQSPQPHGGSNMNGSSWSKFGGEIGFMPAPLEYAYLQNGGHVDRYGHGGYPYYSGSAYPYEDGGQVDNSIDEMKKGGWIKDAVNPAHKGYCTPMTKSTCTPRRKAFAQTMKKHHGFHQYGGPLRKFVDGGDTDDIPNLPPANGSAWGAAAPDQAFGLPSAPTAPQVPVIPVDPNQNTRPPVSPNRANPQETPTDASGFNNPQADQNYAQAPQPMHHRQPFGTGFNNLLGAGLLATSYFEDRRNARNAAGYQRQLGMSDNAFKSQAMQTQGNRGNYDQHGNFRPNEQTYSQPGMFYSQQQYGGYAAGQEVELHPEEIKRLQKLGYKLQMI